MFKIQLLLILVLLSQSILSINGVDDEFAEFDDFPTGEQTIAQDDKINLIKDPTQKSAANNKVDNSQKQADIRLEHLETTDNDVSNIKDEVSDKQKQSQKKPDLKLVNAPVPLIYKWESYYVEFGFLFVGFLYFINYFIGSSKNAEIAKQWYDQIREPLKQQFSLVGGSAQVSDQKRDEDGETKKKQKGLIMSSESSYTLWNSGRVGMDGLLIEVILLKRQDILSMGLNLIYPSDDTVIFHFLLNQDGYENFVFCLAHKKHAAKLARNKVDINTFCPKRKPLSQYGTDNDRLFVMSELSDVASFILDSRTIEFLKNYERSINFIHITDQYSTMTSDESFSAQKLANTKRMATFSFRIPPQASDRIELLFFALSLLDRLRRFKMAKDSKQKSDKNRQRITDILQKTAFSQRQEAAQNKKEELRRLEKERIYNEDDPEKQRRWEKKEAKREAKKNRTMRMKNLKIRTM